MGLESQVRVDLSGETPLTRGSVVAVVVVMVLGIGGITALHMLYRPEPPKLTSRLDELSRTVENVRAEQAELSADQTALRKEMKEGFARLHKLLEKKPGAGD